MKKLILIILESSYATAAQDFYLAIIPATCTIFLNVNISKRLSLTLIRIAVETYFHYLGIILRYFCPGFLPGHNPCDLHNFLECKHS